MSGAKSSNPDQRGSEFQSLTENTPLTANSGILQRYFKKFILSYERAADPCYFSLQMSIYVVASVAIFSMLFCLLVKELSSSEIVEVEE